MNDLKVPAGRGYVSSLEVIPPKKTTHITWNMALKDEHSIPFNDARAYKAYKMVLGICMLLQGKGLYILQGGIIQGWEFSFLMVYLFSDVMLSIWKPPTFRAAEMEATHRTSRWSSMSNKEKWNCSHENISIYINMWYGYSYIMICTYIYMQHAV